MTETAQKTDPKLWEEVKTDVTKGDKGGRPGQWSARKAQMATQEYKKEGGGYKGAKSSDNHLNSVDGGGLGHKIGRRQRRDRRALSSQEGTRTAQRR